MSTPEYKPSDRAEDRTVQKGGEGTLDGMTYLLCLLLALPFWHLKTPEVFRVKFETTAGSFLIEANRDWSPHGADRFYELVRTKYYDDSRFFRVVAGRWVQFGINGNPRIAQQQRHITIPDDPPKQHNTPGYVAFSNTGPNTRSTQVYINLGDNTARNDIEAGFAPFGQVVEGMDVVEKLYGGYGEHSGGGMRAGHQDQIFEGGNAYLDREYPKLDKIIRATITKSN
jgi:homoserine O-acetyltransferase